MKYSVMLLALFLVLGILVWVWKHFRTPVYLLILTAAVILCAWVANIA